MSQPSCCLRSYWRGLAGRHAQAGATIYVSPNGNDNWSGGLAQPNGSRHGRSRRHPRTGTGHPATEEVGGRRGETRRHRRRPIPTDEALRADPRGQRRHLRSSARRSSGLLRRQESFVDSSRARTGSGRLASRKWPNGSWYFDQLFVNGHRAARAKTPNKFYSYMGPTKEVPVDGKPGQFLRTTNVPAETIAPLKGLSEAEIRDVVLVAYHKWCITRRYLTARQLRQQPDRHDGREAGELLRLARRHAVPPGELQGRPR